MLDEQKADKIRKAIALLDADNDDHWKDDHTPRTGVVQRIAKDTTITREEILEICPWGFRADAPRLGPEPDPEPEVVDFGQPIEPERFDVVTVESEMVTADEPAPALVPEPVAACQEDDTPPLAPEPIEEAPNFTHQECMQALLDLDGELHGLRHQRQLLARQLIEAETKARQAAVEFERGEYHPSAYELTRATIDANNSARFAAGPQSSRGTAWEFARKNMQYGGRRLVSVLDENGNQTLARNVDGSLAVPVPRSKMRLNWTGTPQRQVSIPFGAPKNERTPTPLIHNKPITIHMQEPAGKK
jgi:hypothetical protein